LAICNQVFCLVIGVRTGFDVFEDWLQGVATAIISGEGYASNNAGVIMFTLLSVHCAERITATSN